MENQSSNTIVDFWSASLAQHPERVALIYCEQKLTYQEVDKHIEDAVTVLIRAGIGEKSKVTLMAPNEPAFVIVTLAALKLGAVVCPLNVSTTSKEFNELKDLIEPDILILSAIPAQLQAQLGDTLPVAKLTGNQLESVDSQIETREPEPELNDVAFILCTSGTTGLPKAGMLTHENIVTNLHAFKAHLCRWPGNKWLDHEIFGNVIPLSHPYGLIMMTLMPLFLGGTVVLMPAFSPKNCLRTIQEKKITFFGGVPSMYATLNKYRQVSRYDVSSCRYWICGGAPLPSPVRIEFKEVYAADINEGFGMLETSSIATLDFGDPADHHGSVGPLVSTMKAQIRDPEGKKLPLGNTGDLWLKGYNIMKGYYRNQHGTMETIQDGWLKTGDLGYMDTDGYLYLNGRFKDLMIVDGHNVYPREVEAVLLKHASVADAAVTAAEANARGDEILAYVVPSDYCTLDEKELISYCRKELSSFKVPRKLFVVNQIPRNVSGKILRNQLAPGQ